MIGRQIVCDYFTRYSAGPWHEPHKHLSGEDGADSDDVRKALILWLSSREHRRTEGPEQELCCVLGIRYTYICAYGHLHP